MLPLFTRPLGLILVAAAEGPDEEDVSRFNNSVFLDGETATPGDDEEGDDAEPVPAKAEAGMEKPTIEDVGSEFLEEDPDASVEFAGRSNEAHDFLTAGAAGAVGSGAGVGAGAVTGVEEEEAAGASASGLEELSAGTGVAGVSSTAGAS
jgi:hypothetical protein